MRTNEQIAADNAKLLGQRLLGAMSDDGTTTMWSEDMARVVVLQALDDAKGERKELDAEIERALNTVMLWTTDWKNTPVRKQDVIIAGLRDNCGGVLDKIKGEHVQTPQERITYLVRALGSIAHVCSNNENPSGLPYEVRGIVERAIRGLPNPISAVGSDVPSAPKTPSSEDRVRPVDGE